MEPGGEARKIPPGGPKEKVRKPRKTVVGEVVSDRMQKTIAVRVTRLEKHPRYHKYIRRSTTFKAHDENEEARVGDLVRIAQTRRLSKTKHWRLVEIVRRSTRGVPAAEAAAETEESSS